MREIWIDGVRERREREIESEIEGGRERAEVNQAQL